MNLFVSGPLMFRDVIQAVAGKTFPMQDGVLRGYIQFTLEQDGQSAMIPFPDRVVDGLVYLGVDEEALARIDAFEGALFERVEVSVESPAGEWIEAEAYCIKLSRKRLLTSREWDEDEYRQNHLQKVLALCRK